MHASWHRARHGSRCEWLHVLLLLSGFAMSLDDVFVDDGEGQQAHHAANGPKKSTVNCRVLFDLFDTESLRLLLCFFVKYPVLFPF